MTALLLPPSSTLHEKAIVDAADLPEVLDLAVDAVHYSKWEHTPPSFLPFLIYELGLGELTPYVDDLTLLIKEGVVWQRVRGTPDAVKKALGWLKVTAKNEQAWHGRNWWNSYQLRFDSLPVNDYPLLERIEAVAILSVPKRSQLRRGVYHYDAGALIADGSVLDHAMLERESGIAVTPAGTLWSFGRAYEFNHFYTEAEGLALGNWIEPVAEASLSWADMNYPWVDANFPWIASGVTQREAFLAGWFNDQTLYLVLKDQFNQVIGYRRCRSCFSVSQNHAGAYRFSSNRYAPQTGGTALYVEAITDFGNAADVDAYSVSLLVGGELAEGVKPGCLWLQPDQIRNGIEIAVQNTSIPLRATVREQLKFLVRF